MSDTDDHAYDADNDDEVMVQVMSLPYIDEYTDEDARMAEELVAAEMNTFTPPDYLESFPSFEWLSTNPLLQQEIQRVQQQQQPLSAIVPAYNPASTTALTPPLSSHSVSEWQQAVDRAKIAIGHELTTCVNLELMQRFGSNAWRVANDELTRHLHQRSVNIRETTAQQNYKLNVKRKAQQLQAAQTMHNLEAQWWYGVAKNHEIRAACNEEKSRSTHHDDNDGGQAPAKKQQKLIT